MNIASLYLYRFLVSAVMYETEQEIRRPITKIYETEQEIRRQITKIIDLYDPARCNLTNKNITVQQIIYLTESIIP